MARLQNADARGDWERRKYTMANKVRHGETCEKVRHADESGVGYSHSGDDDSEYFTGGKRYCARCHEYIPNKGDGKYEARDGQIVKKTTGEPIPEDEPIFILRGRDRLAEQTLGKYMVLALEDKCTAYHIQGIAEALTAFAKFTAGKVLS